jgi:Glycosyl hydrolase 36 superfamily, catalytic domain
MRKNYAQGRRPRQLWIGKNTGTMPPLCSLQHYVANLAPTCSGDTDGRLKAHAIDRGWTTERAGYGLSRIVPQKVKVNAFVVGVRRPISTNRDGSPDHRDAARHGEAKNSWLTGTAAWNYYAITQWILGIRVTYDGLEIAPVIPESWEGFAVRRTFRGVTYSITVDRVGSGNEVTLVVDDELIQGNVVGVPTDGRRRVSVTAEVGKAHARLRAAAALAGTETGN